MNCAATQNHLTTSNFEIELVNDTPNPARLKQGKADRKRALIVLSCALTIAVGCIAVVIGTSAAEAASLQDFTAANALTAKQDANVAGIAAASLTFIAFGALALFSSKKM